MNELGWPFAEGEMAQRIVAFDWGQTALGPLDEWPIRLRLAVEIVLASPLPAMVLWGDELVQIYNDACRGVFAAKHPGALGAPLHISWPETRAYNELIFEAIRRGEPCFRGRQKFILERSGMPEDAWFDLVYTPLRDDAGFFPGALINIHEITAEVVAERCEEAAAASLRASEQRFRALVSASSDVMYRMSPDWSEMIHLDGGGVVQGAARSTKNWLEASIDAADWAQVVDTVHAAIDERRAFALEHRVRRVDRSIGWIKSRAVPIFDDAGEIVEWFGAATDVTARREAEEALRDSEARFRQFGDASADVLWMRDAVTLDWVYLSPAFEQIYGLRREPGLAGKGLEAWLSVVHHEDRQRVRAVLEDVRNGAHASFGYRIVRPSDGDVRWLRSNDFAIYNTAGEVVRIGGVAHDATEEVEARQMLEAASDELAAANRDLEMRVAARTAQLDESARQMRLVTNAMPASIAFVDAGERFVFANDGHRTLWSRTEDDVTGRQIKDIVGEIVYTHIAEHVVAALSGKGCEFELELPRSGGRPPRHLLATYVPNVGANGNADGFFELAIDVSELKTKEQKLQLLIGELDHRVRNMLTMILAMIARAAQGPDSKDEMVHTLSDRIRALARTQTLLTQGGASGAELRALLEQELDPHGRPGDRFAVRGPDLVVAPKPALFLGLVLHELATNAAKYGAFSTPDGRVEVSWHLSGGPDPTVDLAWTETGGPPVLPPTRRGFGSLLMSRAIEYELGATASLSFAPTGFACQLSFPARRALATVAEPRPPRCELAHAPDVSARPGAVLIVEDDALIALDTCELVESEGYVVAGLCATVEDALAVLDDEKPAFALLDVNLGGRTSFVIAERLIEICVPFAFVTGYERDLAIPVRYAGTPVVQKPTTPAAIRELLRRHAITGSRGSSADPAEVQGKA